MMKRFVRKMCMVLAVCMLFTALPIPSLAQEAAATAQAAATAAPTEKATTVETVTAAGDAAEETGVEPADGEEPAPEAPETEESAPEGTEPAGGEAAPEETEPAGDEAAPEETAPAESEAASIVSFALAEEGIAVPRGTAETDLGLPTELTATFSDGTSALVAVTWVCVDDGQGGTAYSPENSAESVFTFRAVLVEDIPCDAELPTMGVAILDAPMPLALPSNCGIAYEGSGDHEETFDGGTITLKKGNYNINGANVGTYSKIVVCAGASLAGDMGHIINADIVIDGGRLSISAPNGIRGIRSVVLNSGSARIERGSGDTASGPVPQISVNGGTLILNDCDVRNLTVTGGCASMNSSSTASNLTATGGEIEVFTKSEVGTANLKNCSIDVNQGIVRSLTLDNVTGSTLGYYTEIDDLRIESVPTSGLLNLGGSIVAIALGDSAAKAIAEANWPEESAIPGETPKAVEVRLESIHVTPNLNMPGSWVDSAVLTYTPTNPDQVLQVGDPVAYTVSVGGAAAPSTITQTVPEALYLKGGAIAKTYDGNGEFTNNTVDNPVWTDGAGVEYSSIGGSVTVNASVEGVDAGSYLPGGVKVNSVQVAGTAPEGKVFSTDAAHATGLTATINKAEVSIIGTIYRNGPEDQLTWQEALRQPSVTITGLVEGETIENWENVTLMSPPPHGGGENINSLTGDFGYFPGLVVWEITLTSKNYVIKRSASGPDYNLYVEYRRSSNPYITMADWYTGPGELPFPEPVLTGREYDERSVKYEYRPAGSTDETAWTAEQPTEVGDYQVRAVLGAYNEYLPETTTPVSFSIRKLSWSLKLELSSNQIEFEDKVTCTIRLIADPAGAQYDPDFPTSGVMELYVDDELIPLQKPEIDASSGAYVDELVNFLPYESPYKITAKYTKDGYVYTSNSEDLLIKKKDISEKFYTQRADGVYNGMNETGAVIHVVCDSQVLSLINDVEVSITRNGKDWLFDDDEVSLRNEGCFFEPLQAGKYTMTVKVKESKDFYTGSYTSDPITVAKRPLMITMKAGTVEQGQPFTPEYEIDSGYPLADGDAIVLGPCYYNNDEKLTDTSKLEVNQEYPYALATKNIVAENGTDVTDSYMWVNDLSNAKVTVTAPKTEIAVSFAADDIVTHKTLTTTWTPNRDDLSFDVYTEVGKAFAVICKTDDGYVELPELNDFADALTMNIIDEEGEPVKGFENAGTYRLVFSLKPGVSDRYALRLGDSPDTLTFTIPQLDLASDVVQVGEILPAIYDYETGEATDPGLTSVQVEYEEAVLEEGIHYTIEYREGYNHNQPGDAYLWIVPCEGNANVTGEKKVKYTIVAPTRFTITIPASVSLSDNAGSMTIGCKLQGSDAEVSVTVGSQNNFCLVNESDSNKLVGYSLLRDGESIQYDWSCEAAHFTKPADSDPLAETDPTQELTFEVYNMPAPGNYSDQLTFTASVVSD